jgi:hypothetical protein
MNFEDELKELIHNARVEAGQKSQDLLRFRDAWQKTKMQTVKPLLDQAAKALQIYAQRNATVELRNGSIFLTVGYKDGSRDVVTNQLSFSANEEKREIECSYRNPQPVDEGFTLDKLDQTAVQNKIKEFLRAVLG